MPRLTAIEAATGSESAAREWIETHTAYETAQAFRECSHHSILRWQARFGATYIPRRDDEPSICQPGYDGAHLASMPWRRGEEGIFNRFVQGFHLVRTMLDL